MDPSGRDAGLILLLLQSEWHEALIVDPPDKVYHYTTAAGFNGIAREAMLRATNFGYLNDPSELRYGRNLALQLLESAARSGPGGDLIAQTGCALEAKAVSETYVSCFTTLGDDPKLWMEYCGSGPERYCISFDGRKMASEFNTRPGGRFARVLYKPAEQEQLIASLVERTLTFVEKQEISPESWDGVADALVRAISMRLPELKDPKHKHESEWRIIRWHDGLAHDVVSFDTSREVPRPYLPVPLKPLKIDSVTRRGV
jgi:hypothetical protein